MSQTFQEILLDYGVWVAETTSTAQPSTATCKALPERVELLPAVSFKPSRLKKSSPEDSVQHNFGRGFTGPLHTFSPTQPLNCSNSYGSPGFTRPDDSQFDASEDEVASQAPSLTFSTSTLSPGRSITSPTTPITALQLSHRPSSRKAGSRDNSPQKGHADNKSKCLNISFPIQQQFVNDSSTASYHNRQGTMDEASYKPKRPAPTPPTSIDFTMQVTPPSETSFMDWDDNSGRLQLRNTLRRTGTKKQNSSHRHVVRHQASTESFSHYYAERGRSTRRVNHMHTTSEELKHDYPHKLAAAKSMDNLLRVPDTSRHEGARLAKRPGTATKSPSRSDKSSFEVKSAQQPVEAESTPGKFRGLVKTLITKLSHTSLRTRAHESPEDNGQHKLRPCASNMTLRQRHMMS